MANLDEFLRVQTVKLESANLMGFQGEGLEEERKLFDKLKQSIDDLASKNHYLVMLPGIRPLVAVQADDAKPVPEGMTMCSIPAGEYVVFRFEEKYIGEFWNQVCTKENQKKYRIDLSKPRFEIFTPELRPTALVEWYIPSRNRSFKCEIVKKEETRLVGMSFAGPFPDSFPASAIELHRRFWPRRHEIKGARHGVLVSPYFGNESFTTYWACCEVDQFDSIPDGMAGITIPAREYAKVSCTNKTIHEGYTQLHEWMKQKGLKKADKACAIEVFYIEEAKDEEVVELLSPIVPQDPDKMVERIDAVFLPVRDLEQSKAWYQETFGFKLRYEDQRFVGLAIAPNCGFHLVHVPDWTPSPKYTPINFASRDAENARVRLIERGVKVSDWRPGEPKRFDFWDNTGNIISFIQL